MLAWAVIFFVIALCAAVLGFSGIAVGAALVAKVLFVIFLLAFVASVLLSLFRA